MLGWILLAVGVLLLAFVGLLVWAKVTGPAFPPGTLAFEAMLTRDVLLRTIAERQSRIASSSPTARAKLEAEITFLNEQLVDVVAVVAAKDTSPGRGYIGFDVFGTKTSSWTKVPYATQPR